MSYTDTLLGSLTGFSMFNILGFSNYAENKDCQKPKTALLLVFKGAMCKILSLIPWLSNTSTLGFPGCQILMLWFGRSGRPPTQRI